MKSRFNNTNMKVARKAFSTDFRALELKLTTDSTSPHTIYFKEHSVREHSSDKPSGRTLFVINIPPYANEQGIKNAFAQAGHIQTVQFAEKPTATETKITNTFLPEINKPCFRVAYVVFDKVSHLDKALKLTELSPMNSKERKVKVGLDKWIEEYNMAVWHPKRLKESIEEFMANFDKEMEIADKKEKELESADADGWVTVTKKGKVKNFARSQNVENKIMAKEEKNKKRKELKNFYTFQIRESKMKHIVALRQKFEEDKQKIQQIKQTRRFKPF